MCIQVFGFYFFYLKIIEGHHTTEKTLELIDIAICTKIVVQNYNNST